jgi:flagellar biosynthesis regulator FlaF
MTLSELRYIVDVANERSFGRAARRCFVSQPALSVAIQKLEEELGARLFDAVLWNQKVWDAFLVDLSHDGVVLDVGVRKVKSCIGRSLELRRSAWGVRRLLF